MRLLIAGGGTGGHVNAGIAILDEYKIARPGSKVLFVGTKRGLESELVPKSGYPIKYINARGLKRESLFVLVKSFLLLPWSFIQSFFIVLFFNPKIVIGVGGFASGPVLLCAALLLKKTYILEQNTVVGFTNRLLLKFVKKVFIAFPLAHEASGNYILKFNNKFIHTGNPVRNSLSVNHIDNGKFNIFIFGGSQGARAINNCISATIDLLNGLDNLRIVHQSGKYDYDDLLEAYQQCRHEYEIHKYIYNIEKIYETTDLVIARSGASTISELIQTNIPSILIPLPTAADNHQYYNALYLQSRKMADIIEQKALNPSSLFKNIKLYYDNPDKLKEIRHRLFELSKVKKAQELIVETIVSL